MKKIIGFMLLLCMNLGVFSVASAAENTDRFIYEAGLIENFAVSTGATDSLADRLYDDNGNWWCSNRPDGNDWVMFDLGEVRKLSGIHIASGSFDTANNAYHYAHDFTVSYATDETAWNDGGSAAWTVAKTVNGNEEVETDVIFDEVVEGRFVKIQASRTKLGGWWNVSGVRIYTEVLYKAPEQVKIPRMNFVAISSTRFAVENVFNGTLAEWDYWQTEANDAGDWFMVDMGEQYPISGIIFHQQAGTEATSVNIYTSNSADALSDANSDLWNLTKEIANNYGENFQTTFYPVTAQYVMVKLTANSVRGGWWILQEVYFTREMDLTSVKTENLIESSNITVSAVTYRGSDRQGKLLETPDKATDGLCGDFNSWNLGRNTQKGDWIMLDLGQEYNVDEISMLCSGNSALSMPSKMSVSISAETEAWENPQSEKWTAVDITSPTGNITDISLNKAGVKYIMLMSEGNEETFWYMDEIYVYGTDLAEVSAKSIDKSLWTTAADERNIVIDMKNIYAVDGASLNQTENPQNYGIKVSRDGVNYSDFVFSGKNSVAEFEMVRARFVKIEIIEANTETQWELDKIDIFGTTGTIEIENGTVYAKLNCSSDATVNAYAIVYDGGCAIDVIKKELTLTAGKNLAKIDVDLSEYENVTGIMGVIWNNPTDMLPITSSLKVTN